MILHHIIQYIIYDIISYYILNIILNYTTAAPPPCTRRPPVSWAPPLML